ncbi:unnamed protein product [Cylindrotheca closterium]|uniref:Uncharacterized protein n=1 Tax=Cylindrotheca closterium TaxID=2856 RepID=A0AAD2FDI6_9STRA|nr:unnamed protein product [Cylindrotheca closterium]
MSDFTDSDATSVSMSLAGDKNQKQTPESPPSATTGRPPIIGTRSKSVGLPPLNPNSSLGNSPIATPRNRCDTAEFTKASNTSSTSRHRRLEQFEFSQQSLSSIWSHEPHNPRPTTTPPAEVHFPDGDDYLQFGNSSFASSFDDASGFEAWSVGHDPPIGPSVHISDLRPVIDEAKKNPAARPPRPDRPRRTKGGRKKKLKPEMSMPMYLRKRASLDEKVTGNLVISGWVAASLYDDALDERLAEPSSKMTLGDMFYMQIMEATTTAYIDLYDPSGILAHHLVLKKDWGCSSREVTSRIGKMVFIQSPILSIVRLLPISLEDAFFNGENLISSKEFSRAQSMLFVSGAGKVYAPDEQHDAATFILFTLDALVKQFGI